ncbi:MAG: hypothetical protein JO010_06215, partial [Alphaproteobacteria bacterium]|nr:hypothetical protein [Alphaproteobacteria bacterium]
GSGGSAAGGGGDRGDAPARAAFLESPAATHIAEGSVAKGSVTLVSAFKDPLGRPCRVYRQTVRIGTSRVHALGKVCRQADGAWALIR